MSEIPTVLQTVLQTLVFNGCGKIIENDYGSQFVFPYGKVPVTDDEILAAQLSGSLILKGTNVVIPGGGRPIHTEIDNLINLLSVTDMNKCRITHAKIGTKLVIYQSGGELHIISNRNTKNVMWQDTNITEYVKSKITFSLPENIYFEVFLYNPFFSSGDCLGTFVGAYNANCQELSLSSFPEVASMFEIETTIEMHSPDEINNYLNTLPVYCPGLIIRTPGRYKRNTYYVANKTYMEEIDNYVSSNNLFLMTISLIKNNSSIPNFPKLKELYDLIRHAIDVIANFGKNTFNKRYSKFINVNKKKYSTFKYVLHYEMQTPNTQLWRENILNKEKHYQVSHEEVVERILKYGVLGIANMLLYAFDYKRTNVFEVLEYTEENLRTQIRNGPGGEESLKNFKFQDDKKFPNPYYPYLSEDEVKTQREYLRTNAEKEMEYVNDLIATSSVVYIFEEQMKPRKDSKLRYHSTLLTL